MQAAGLDHETPSTSSPANVKLGSPLSPSDIRDIKRHLHLSCHKWDTQVGDESVLFDQALILPGREWDWLCRSAEKLAVETLLLEEIVVGMRRYEWAIGVPKLLWEILVSKDRRHSPDAPATRAMRFDFHPTTEGWRVSEVNSDVPGGWTEASTLPILYQPFYREMDLPTSPLDRWSDSMRSIASNGRVALLSAPGFLEDQQVIFAFMRRLRSEDVPCSVIQNPAALDWSSGQVCTLRATGQRIAAIVRFYQLEWLSGLPSSTGWKKLLQTSGVPVTNPSISAVSESKRFPLAFNDCLGCSTWRSLIAECRDPRDVRETDWEEWVLKASYSNTGERIYLLAAISGRERKRLVRRAQSQPLKWVAQRRFETLAVSSIRGPLYPCVGVFVIDGRAAGGYVRLSSTQITDSAAKEAPLFIDRTGSKDE